MTEPREQERFYESDAVKDLGRQYERLLHDSQELETTSASTAAAEPSDDAVPPSPARIIEALLFVGGAPLTATRACETIRGLTPGQFVKAIDTLNRDYHRQGRPYAIQPQHEGYVLGLRPAYKPVLEKLYGAVREVRLSAAAVEVLALVAYRQPATKQEIDGIRGAESGGILRQLVRRGLIAVVQRGDSAQREISYGTTERFLEFFGLKSLDDLPRAQDLQSL
jgi:segregation and condensation protein B